MIFKICFLFAFVSVLVSGSILHDWDSARFWSIMMMLYLILYKL